MTTVDKNLKQQSLLHDTEEWKTARREARAKAAMGRKQGNTTKQTIVAPLGGQPRMGWPRSPRRCQDAKIKEITIRGFKQGRGKRGSGGRITHDNMEGDSPRPSGCWVLSSAIVDATGGDTRIFIGGIVVDWAPSTKGPTVGSQGFAACSAAPFGPLLCVSSWA